MSPQVSLSMSPLLVERDGKPLFYNEDVVLGGNLLSDRNSQLTVRILSRHSEDCHRGSQERICLVTRSALGGPKLDMTTIV